MSDAMLTNYERVIKKFIPAFRLKAAQMMVNEYGLKQQQAADILGTTQAAVSKYLKEGPDKFSKIKIERLDVATFVESMKADNTKNGQKVMCKVCQENKKFDCAFIVK